MDLSIIIVSYNVQDYVRECLTSIFAQPPQLAFEVIVVDNVSRDRTVEIVQEEFPGVTLICNQENVGLAAATNQGVEVSTGRYVLYLNPDTRLDPGTLEGLVRFAGTRPDAAAFTCRVRNPDGSLQHSCFRFPGLGQAWYGFFPVVPMDSVQNGRYPEDYYERLFEPEHVLGAFLMVRRATLERIGAWDPGFFMYFEETDFCYRLRRAGLKALYVPQFSFVHYGGRSTAQVSEKMSVAFYRSQARFYLKHYGIPKYLALKAVVLVGLAFWLARSCLSFARGRIDWLLLRTRLGGYARILFA